MAYTREYLIQYLQDKAKELQRTPTVYDVKNPSYRVFYNKFGSWINALEEAGLYERTITVVYSRETLINILKEKAGELRRLPYEYEIDVSLRRQYLKLFGKWKYALVEAGLKEEKRVYTRDELLDRLKSMHQELGRLPRADEVCRADYMDYKKCFGSWKNALVQAGLKSERKEYVFDRQELLERVKKLQTELGRIPRADDISRNEYKLYKKCFGSWRNMLKEAGMKSDKKKYTKEELIERIQQLYRELGRIPKTAELKNPSYDTYKMYFNSWAKVLECAGLDKPAQ